MLKYTIKSFSYPKEGNSLDENEDAFITSPNESSDGFFRIAVADGATESSFSKEWADLLVSYFYAFDYKNDFFFSRMHPILKKSWLERINAHDLPWYAQQKLEMGAFASFLGVDVNLENGECNIIAIGDSNIFVFRNNEMKVSFPIEKAEHFGNTPFLISSELRKNNVDERFFSEEIFQLIAGDTVILGTDAIGQWILTEIEKGVNPLNTLMPLINDEDADRNFLNWLNEERKNREIKNDDTTIILIKFSDGTT